MVHVDYAAVGQRIRRRRRQLKFTQEQLAERAGIAASFLGHIERGTRKASMETFLCIADALRISLSALFPLEYETTPADFTYKEALEAIIQVIAENTSLLDRQEEE